MQMIGRKKKRPPLNLTAGMLLLGILFGNAAAGEETYADSIFLGMKLYVQVDGKEYPLLYYRDRRHHIVRDGRVVALSPPVDLTFKKAIRHSDRAIRLYEFETVPYSSEVADRLSRYSAAISQRNAQAAQVDQAIAAQANLVSVSPDVPDGFNIEMAYAQAQANMGTNTSGLMSDLRGTEESLQTMREELGEGGHNESFDALAIKVKIRPSQDLDHCYLFVRATYLEPGDKPVEARDELYRIHFEELGHLKAGREYPKQFMMGGFPPGPRITEMSYHLYSGTEEIPSDFSEQRILVSEDEAYDFLFADLFSQSAPVNAEPRLFKPLSLEAAGIDLPPAAPEETRLALTVRADGAVSDIVVENSPAGAEADVLALASRLRFLPAMEDGVPVDRRVRFPLRRVLSD